MPMGCNLDHENYFVTGKYFITQVTEYDLLTNRLVPFIR